VRPGALVEQKRARIRRRDLERHFRGAARARRRRESRPQRPSGPAPVRGRGDVQQLRLVVDASPTAAPSSATRKIESARSTSAAYDSRDQRAAPGRFAISAISPTS
jgi:hypothetical protein